MEKQGNKKLAKWKFVERLKSAEPLQSVVEARTRWLGKWAFLRATPNK
jgi:hypothetical protein